MRWPRHRPELRVSSIPSKAGPGSDLGPSLAPLPCSGLLCPWGVSPPSPDAHCSESRVRGNGGNAKKVIIAERCYTELEFVLTVGARIPETVEAGGNGSHITCSDFNYILTLISNILPLGISDLQPQDPCVSLKEVLYRVLCLKLCSGGYLLKQSLWVDHGGVWGVQAQGRSGKGASWFWGWGTQFSCLVLGDPQGVEAGNQLKMLHFQLTVSFSGSEG